MVALVYAKYLSEDHRSTVVRKSQVIAQLHTQLNTQQISLSWGFRQI